MHTAIEFSKHGANVTLFARDEAKLLLAKNKLINLENQKHNILVGDFNKPDEIFRVLNDNLENTKYNVLVNNSGGPKGGKIIEAENKEFQQTFNRHLICNHIITKLVLPNMIETNYGRIINIISTSVKQPIVGLGVSNTIRAAVAAWAKTISLEINNNGITINNVLPGFTNTGRLDSIIKTKSQKSNLSIEKVTKELIDEVPLNRFAEPSEVAQLVTFLASKDASYINGTSIPIDGGRITTL